MPKIGGGRVAAYEMLVVEPAIANLIRENKTFRINSAIQTGAKKGMILLDDSLFNLWKAGKSDRTEDALGRSQQPRGFSAPHRQRQARHLRRRRRCRDAEGEGAGGGKTLIVE